MTWRRPLFILVVVFTLGFTGLYLMTARIYEEGSLGESVLVLKPSPSLDHAMGGGEDGAWARHHPGEAAPWWQSKDIVKLAWGGDWETPVGWTAWYELGYVLTPLLWLLVAAAGIYRLVQAARGRRGR